MQTESNFFAEDMERSLVNGKIYTFKKIFLNAKYSIMFMVLMHCGSRISKIIREILFIYLKEIYMIM